jgi:hypothetical protein
LRFRSTARRLTAEVDEIRFGAASDIPSGWLLPRATARRKGLALSPYRARHTRPLPIQTIKHALKSRIYAAEPIHNRLRPVEVLLAPLE